MVHGLWKEGGGGKGHEVVSSFIVSPGRESDKTREFGLIKKKVHLAVNR